ncbi:unnamed protein product [Protopolystoma xenopodis]|uniref:Uncharacterized protein n=1 Tax=Protopolystoma xenopodis TaxID=117903 RepID=A0A448WUU1_9PLAT|nr:unnamed protein product [Protopolystoma xenopodis]
MAALETITRMRPKLEPNPNFTPHLAASMERDGRSISVANFIGRNDGSRVATSRRAISRYSEAEVGKPRPLDVSASKRMVTPVTGE